jgi:bifunctional DNase/RNase
MDRKLVNVFGISTSSVQNNTFALILVVSGTPLRIPIIIGGYEAQAIAIQLEGLQTSRPLTHDLMRSVMSNFDISLKEVTIHDFREGVFYASMLLTDGIQTHEQDCRTSDAVALALRLNAPIYISDQVIEMTAISEEIESSDLDPEEEEDGELSVEELEAYLQELIEREEYEEASQVRDEINKLKNNTE